MARLFFPYSTPRPDDVAFDSWAVVPNAVGAKVVEERVEGWDHTVDLDVSVEVRADPTTTAKACGLGPGSQFAAVLGWHSTGSGLRGTVVSRALAETGTSLLEGRLDGASLGGVLRLNAARVLT